MALGFCGAHRTGKTTLAKLVALRAKLAFIPTSTSQIMLDAGYDPRVAMTFRERLTVQQIILTRTVNETYRKMPGNAVCDRTPLDMLAYTLAEVRGDSLTPDMEKELKAYAVDCFMATNHFFTAVLLIQPGIPIVDAEGKAAPSTGYLEHLNYLLFGLCSDPRLTSAHFYMPRDKVDLELRAAAALGAWSKTLERLTLQRTQGDGSEAQLH